jgi:hypothetical protein
VQRGAAARNVDPGSDPDQQARREAVRRLAVIQLELDRSMEKRHALWERQNEAHDPETSAMLKALDTRINRLWAEARATKACIRDGPRSRIIRRVRAEARLENGPREIRKRGQSA